MYLKNTPKPEHMSWTNEAWTGISKFIFSWRQTWVKCVGEHFIYLLIPKFLLSAFVDGSFEAAAGAAVYGPSQVITKVRSHTQLVCMDHGL